MKLRREVKFESGYDCIKFKCKFNSKTCVPNGGGSHGIHGLEIGFYIHGEKGAIQFKISTGWFPQYSKESRIGTKELHFGNLGEYYPMPIDLGYHSYTPHFEGQKPITDKCPILGGKECYYDGSSLNCNDAFYTLLNGGEEELWKFLERYYESVFDGEKYPDVFEYPKELRFNPPQEDK